MMHIAETMELHPASGFVERREGKRHIAVFRVGRLAVGDQDQLCVVRNISPGGCMIEVNRPPALGTVVSIDFRSDKCLSATVRWARERSCGVEFEAPIDVDAILSEERRSIRRLQPRAPRFRRIGQARVINLAGNAVEGPIHNISINGLALAVPASFNRDEPVIVSIEGLGATHAFARWSRDGETGLRLAAPLSYRALADWLDAHQG